MLKAGVIGAGHLGKIHLKLLEQSEKYELLGFYDTDTKSARALEHSEGYMTRLIANEFSKTIKS